MANIIQLVEQELPIVEVFLPILESGISSVIGALPAVYTTPALKVKIAGASYTAEVVFTKVS